ncbi:hypothetical protein CLV98_104371 [Dyadobacter jejuensis]|uniref:Dialkylrecorsinol condensing enzyme n=1 Tax=Dyadobacter jejuensis TaxID=1082580 RepID=A0A316ALR8_9BACT|nr:hypothetical protein [Dyadobacter jejuensis]PWJ58511.1 hypothetical protein CLV98_104371 [Dyadobacter jejuensis]
MRKILAISYTQSGQMDEILGQFLSAFGTSQIEHWKVEPLQPYPFPWTQDEFFDLMPACVLEDEIAIKPYSPKEVQYDLIILAYQPWYLSPSLPATAVLKSECFKSLVKNTPILTLIAGRNMWLNAQESVKSHIKGAGGRLIGNIPLMDRAANLVSVVTILHWMLTGRKDRKWGIFPKPGVSDLDIASAKELGVIVEKRLEIGNFDGMQDQLLKKGDIQIPTDILFIEERAKKLFKIWAKLIITKGSSPEKRKFWVNFFKYYLLVALFMVAPVLVTIYRLLIAPWTQKSINRRKNYYLGLETK